MPTQLVPGLEVRLTHFYERLGIVGSGDHAAVVVAQDDYRRLGQIRPKDALTARIERVAINEGEYLVIGHGRARCSELCPRSPGRRLP
ncbi:hypothetical protein D3C80_1893430 [compost metagenome]